MVKNSTRNEGKTVRKTPEQQENLMIENILENFDFQKCRKAMKALNWSWHGMNDAPSIESLKKSAEERLRGAIQVTKSGDCYKASYFCSSGGLKATAWKNRYGHIEGILLEFVLTDWDSDGDY